jgi:hypothetical protein
VTGACRRARRALRHVRLLPGLFVFIFVIIAKPGYLMPLVPLGGGGRRGVLRSAATHWRHSDRDAGVVNVVHFTPLTPAAFVGERAGVRDQDHRPAYGG